MKAIEEETRARNEIIVASRAKDGWKYGVITQETNDASLFDLRASGTDLYAGRVG